MAKNGKGKKEEATKGVADENAVEEMTAEMIAMAEEDQGADTEQMTTDDLLVPRLIILQAGSPQVKKDKGEFIKEAEVGMFFDGVENLYDGATGICVVPITFNRHHLEWNLREKGGGLVKNHGKVYDYDKLTKKDDKGRLRPLNAHDEMGDTNVVDTCEFFCFIVDRDTGAYQPVAISMASTQLKKARHWNTMMTSARAPRKEGGTYNPARFYFVYRVVAVPEGNAKGDWMGWKITREIKTFSLPEGTAVYQAARDFKKSVESGEVKAREDAPSSDSSGSGFVPPEDDATAAM